MKWLNCKVVRRICLLQVLSAGWMLPTASASIKHFIEIQQLANEGNYQAAASELNRVLQLNPDCDAAQQYDLYSAALLDAECQIHLGSRSQSLKAAQVAIDAADKTDDRDHLAEATAFYVLVDRSKMNVYKPRTGSNRQPVNILDPVSRRNAFPVVLADELDEMKNTRFQAKAMTGLTPLLAAARHMAGIRALEHLLTGETSQSEEFSRAVSRDANRLITNWIADRQHDLDRMQTNAAKLEKVQVATKRGWKIVSKPTGLTDTEKARINAYIEDCGKLPDALSAMNKGFGGTLQMDGIYRASDSLKQSGLNLLQQFEGK